MKSALRIASLFLLNGIAATAGFISLGGAAQADQDVQVIEVSAKKYEFDPSPIRVKQGTKVQLRICGIGHGGMKGQLIVEP